MLEYDEIVKRILDIAPDQINLVIIFGSRARLDHSQLSDLDIAVSTSIPDKRHRFQLRLQIISQFDGQNLPVDVVIIEDANWTLRHRIARDGIVIYQKEEDAWPDFVERVLIYYPDYRIFEQQFLEKSLGGK